jgi:carbonic anhydrase/acetyltransferase-like protein (isoleucine patch superfamily)
MIRSWKGITPQIHPRAFVSEFAYVVGDVEIGEGSSVWPGTVIRGDAGKIVIGKNTCIQDNSTVHADGRGAVIGDYVVMGHNVLCHADRVGDGAALGNGAVVSGSTEIGEGSIIGAGALLIDGAIVPPHTLMLGVPAVAKGAVSDKQRERFRWTAEHYAQLARQYKAEELENTSADPSD